MIADVTVFDDAYDTSIDLSNVFYDVDDDNASITKVSTSSDTSLMSAVVSGDVLTLAYQPDQNGTATITVTATSNGQTIDDQFTVVVTATNDPPVVVNAIADFSVAEDAPNTAIGYCNKFGIITATRSPLSKPSTVCR